MLVTAPQGYDKNMKMDIPQCGERTYAFGGSLHPAWMNSDSSELKWASAAEVKMRGRTTDQSTSCERICDSTSSSSESALALSSVPTSQDPPSKGRIPATPTSSISLYNPNTRRNRGSAEERRKRVCDEYCTLLRTVCLHNLPNRSCLLLAQSLNPRPHCYHSKEHGRHRPYIERSAESLQGSETQESSRAKGKSGILNKLCCTGIDFVSEPETPKQISYKKVVPQHRGNRARRSTNQRHLTASAIEEKKFCLVLDLDETLIHATFQEMQAPDFVVDVPCANSTFRINVKKRPYLDEFLGAMSQNFEIGIFTAAVQSYAEEAIHKLGSTAVNWKLYRSSCTIRSDQVVKDLRTLKRDLSRTIIIDDNSNSFLLQPENGVQCASYTGEPDDTELLKLKELLDSIPDDVDDIRTFLAERNSSDPN
eukprot:gb/GECG01010456.1/.p1 GENE.gb/GECG01010456.1/~~gb/GECG01010456.1/.p1  ORF type:complete len:423 (+),score=32.84 gb/GECG01010456.1/:1-1269(+)